MTFYLDPLYCLLRNPVDAIIIYMKKFHFYTPIQLAKALGRAESGIRNTAKRYGIGRNVSRFYLFGLKDVLELLSKMRYKLDEKKVSDVLDKIRHGEEL